MSHSRRIWWRWAPSIDMQSFLTSTAG